MAKLGAVLAGVGAMVLAANSAEAQTASISGWLPPSHVMTREIHQGFADKVREASGGELDFEVFVGAALLPPLSTMQGVSDGVAQIGHVAAPYQPSELPIANLVGDVGWNSLDPFVLTFAFLDYVMNDPVAYAEWRENGVIPGGAVSTPVNYYICRGDRLQTLDDFEGKRVRTPGGSWARLSQQLGMTPVNIPASEIYSSLERGAVDCVSTDTTNLVSGSTILELVGSIALLPLTPGYNAIHLAYNPDFWQGLTEAQRRLIFDQTAAAMASAQVVYARETEAALDEASKAGVNVAEPDAEVLTVYQEWIADDFGGVTDVGRTTYGIEEPEPIIESFQGYVTKWTGLMEGVDRTDVAAVTAVLKENLFDKVDVATYGLQ